MIHHHNVSKLKPKGAPHPPRSDLATGISRSDRGWSMCRTTAQSDISTLHQSGQFNLAATCEHRSGTNIVCLPLSAQERTIPRAASPPIPNELPFSLAAQFGRGEFYSYFRMRCVIVLCLSPHPIHPTRLEAIVRGAVRPTHEDLCGCFTAVAENMQDVKTCAAFI